MALVYRDEKKIPTQAVDLGERQYPPTEAQVKTLADLIEADGEQRMAILVRQVTRGTYKVVCGATRLKALRLLNWTHIKAKIVGGLPIDYEIAELSDDLGSKHLTVRQQREANRKLKALRQQLAAVAGGVEKAKGGRGKKGGVSEAARKAGVPRTTARDAAKPGENASSRQVSSCPSQEFRRREREEYRRNLISTAAADVIEELGHPTAALVMKSILNQPPGIFVWELGRELEKQLAAKSSDDDIDIPEFLRREPKAAAEASGDG
jgi:ParB/Sulfiredoxin domain